MSYPAPLRIVVLRAQAAEPAAAIRQLRKAGLDNAAANALLSRKCAERDGLMRPPLTASAKARHR